jgi:hypothetical protein
MKDSANISFGERARLIATNRSDDLLCGLLYVFEASHSPIDAPLRSPLAPRPAAT